MNKQSLSLIVLFFALVLTACAQQKKTTGSDAVSTPSAAHGKTTKTKVSKTAPTVSYMSMERTACFGKCPTYTVEIYNTGLIRYTSRMFTEHEGVYEKNVGAAQTQSLLSQYSQNRIDTCSDRYESYIQDLPGIIYVFKYGKTTKKIMNAEFGPEYLKKLSLKVDELAKVDNTWKKVADKPKDN
jgi:hypothetical protein